ncbi:hypothetical protein J2T26_004800 [Citrobacter farmeri]|nr:hypothetical protein [Citrobacter farmeri]MCW2424995.1 hypothetical protein [Citrobacter farmeri]
MLVAVGVARYFGNMSSGVGKATTELIAAKSGTVAMAAVQAELAVARNTSAEALATQNAVAKRRAMIVANAALVQSNQAVAASRKALENATSVTGMLKSGAASLLSLVAGYPVY